MRPRMHSQRLFPRKCFLTHFTFERAFRRVCHHVRFQVILVKVFSAHLTHDPDVQMNLVSMLHVMVLPDKLHRTKIAFVRSSLVRFHLMEFQLVYAREFIPARFTAVCVGAVVDRLVVSLVAQVVEVLSAYFTLVFRPFVVFVLYVLLETGNEYEVTTAGFTYNVS